MADVQSTAAEIRRGRKKEERRRRRKNKRQDENIMTITKRCTYNMASYCSVCNPEVTDDGEALECDECRAKKYGQLVTTPSDTTVNSSHDFTV